MNMQHPDNEDWKKFCEDDAGAFERIYRRHKDTMFTYCNYLIGDRHASEDVVQETFLKLLRQKGRLDIESSLADWLFICARNAALNLLRKRGQEIGQLSLDPGLPGNIDDETRHFIESVLRRLGPDERDLLLMKEQRGYSISEIGKILDISEENVRVRLFRARKRMQNLAKGKI
jgi:RNA polymerase sigma-70 factor (ECF subfamily)